eukprot:gene3590-6325_t
MAPSTNDIVKIVLAVPMISKVNKVICLVCNLFFPGFGTLLGGIMMFTSKIPTTKALGIKYLIIGIVQLCLVPFGIGIIWSYITCIAIVIALIKG